MEYHFYMDPTLVRSTYYERCSINRSYNIMFSPNKANLIKIYQHILNYSSTQMDWYKCIWFVTLDLHHPFSMADFWVLIKWGIKCFFGVKLWTPPYYQMLAFLVDSDYKIPWHACNLYWWSRDWLIDAEILEILSAFVLYSCNLFKSRWI